MSHGLEQDVPERIASAKIDEMIAIWERLFQKSPIRAQDNFFELGGNPPLAERLFDEIEKLEGHPTDPAAICHVPTPQSLATAIEEPPGQMFPPLLPLKTGPSGTAVFIAHGLGGSVLEFFELVKRIRSPHSIYGMQAIGADGSERAFGRIEDMAQFYVSAIQGLQPHGPYLLVGYSLGGLLVWEIAQRLHQRGEKVGLLALIDAYPHQRFLRTSQRLRLSLRRAARHVSILRRLPYRSAFRYLFEPSVRLLHAGVAEGREKLSQRPRPGAARVRELAYVALTRYRPAPYAGTMNFLRAAVPSVFPDNAAEIWKDLARQLEIEDIPGNHYEMLTKHVENLAEVLSRHLEAANDSLASP